MTTISQTKTVSARYLSLDVIRGFAILGILLVNIQGFSMPGSAYLNPTSYGELSGANYWVWLLTYVFADSKFISLFSMLFGASVLLITDASESRGRPPWRLHYSRNFWLLLFGAAHAYLLWYGDILFPYAICGFLIYFFRKRSAKFLIIAGILFFSVASLLYLFFGTTMSHWPEESVEELQLVWNPSPEYQQEEIDAYQGTFSRQMEARVESTIEMQTGVFFMLIFWRVFGLMLIGMALYKSGFLTAKLSKSRYLTLGIIFGIVGFGLVTMGVLRNQSADWSLEYSMFLGFQWNYWGSAFIALAYASGIIWLLLKFKKGFLSQALAKVGRLALSNYLLQTILATTIFYGFGLGLFGEMSRIGQAGVIMGIWLFNFVFSWFWSKYFRYGPFEWLWRTLSYFKLQKITRDR